MAETLREAALRPSHAAVSHRCLLSVSMWRREER